MTRPSSLSDIQLFLGKVGYYRQFIPHFAELAEPFVRLLIKEVPFFWEEEKNPAFNTLREALASSPVLVHPKFDKPFVLFTDASDVAVGVILAQLDENKLGHLIAYYSKTLSKGKRNYSVTKK